MNDDATNPGRYRPGDLFRWTVLKSKDLLVLDQATGELTFADPNHLPSKALVQPIDPLDPYSVSPSLPDQP